MTFWLMRGFKWEAMSKSLEQYPTLNQPLVFLQLKIKPTQENEKVTFIMQEYNTIWGSKNTIQIWGSMVIYPTSYVLCNPHITWRIETPILSSSPWATPIGISNHPVTGTTRILISLVEDLYINEALLYPSKWMGEPQSGTLHWTCSCQDFKDAKWWISLLGKTLGLLAQAFLPRYFDPPIITAWTVKICSNVKLIILQVLPCHVRGFPT